MRWVCGQRSNRKNFGVLSFATNSQVFVEPRFPEFVAPNPPELCFRVSRKPNVAQPFENWSIGSLLPPVTSQTCAASWQKGSQESCCSPSSSLMNKLPACKSWGVLMYPPDIYVWSQFIREHGCTCQASQATRYTTVCSSIFGFCKSLILRAT